MDEKVLNELLNAWEDTYKKGQLTFWVFLALKESPKCVDEIKESVVKLSEGTMSCEEQSLYRLLRKFLQLEMVSFETGKGNRGPDRKYYNLTVWGGKLFNRFVERNIRLLTKENVVSLLNK